MNLFELFVSLSIQDDKFKDQIAANERATKSFGASLGNGIKKAAKIGAVALTVATGAMTAFAKSAIDTGKQFDASMSQVAATMGVTVDEIGELRDFALEMGRTTAFSASQAADALNYMALAGYDAETSMSMLPNVLNLAASGNIDLAAASDMVTDAQTALGLSLDETSVLVDQMAKTASKANTSVAQMGEALLTVGGTAQFMSGGTTELSAVLGVLADNGIKGSEAGTHLRNMLLKLSAPTDDAIAQLQALGVTIFDSTGNMRSFTEIFPELQQAMGDLTSEEQLQALSKIFNTRDIAAAQALIGTSTDRWEELTVAINNASGAAEKMAKTQLDNLAGDITYFKSALEGAKIVLSDQLTPALREFVQFGTNGISKITAAFQEGGLSGAMQAVGDVLSQGITMIIDAAPKMVSAAGELMFSLTTGLLESAPQMMTAAISIIQTLVNQLMQELPRLLPVAAEAVLSLANQLRESLPELIPVAYEAILTFVNGIIDSLPELIEAALEIIVGLAEGLIQALPKLVAKAPDIVISLAKAIIKAVPKIFGAALEIILGIGRGIVNSFGELREKGAEIIGEIKQAILDKIEDIKEAGKEILMGFINGITEKAKWVKDQIGGFVGWVKGLFTGQDAFDIHSPSKWARGIGSFIMQGLGLGLKDSAGEVMETVADIIAEIQSRFDVIADFYGARAGVRKLKAEIEFAGVGAGEMSPEQFARRLELLTNEYNDQQKVIEAAEQAYRAVAKQYGENSTESYNFLQSLLKERKALIDIENDISSLKDEYSELADAQRSYTNAVNQQKAGSKLVESMYELWANGIGKTVDLADQYATKIAMFERQQADQVSLVEAASKAYEEAVQKYGAGSWETVTEQQNLIDQLTTLQNINSEIEALIENRDELRMGGGTSWIDFSQSSLGQTSAATINAMQDIRDQDISLTAEMVTPEGTKLATWLLAPLINVAQSRGTPIVNPA